MSKQYKLIDSVHTRTTLNVARNHNGAVKYEHVTLFPAQSYELEEDPLFIQSLKNAEIKRKYSKTLVNELDALGISYKESSCKSCGGKVKQISYKVVEIVEE
ncbi:hypothetical protein IW492_01965 [Enterococcus sp. BWB1-3]|uniref:hypothetical protein n=1 Tax=unclassified Enterococcus TaxID=2608891 RepID=UPI001920B4F6|nr:MULTISPECIES: hypothetical protein [unclassified Enterococcus]MBL1227995.1 hypothetical protein [Enterococcus sp. BWB1-3]MCB5951835.1 hypothetical protein [Enterococcus sp. BWT-B8]MCB5954032.1 hypothetical protein [Enterococcus sp. CWB-B31]